MNVLGKFTAIRGGGIYSNQSFYVSSYRAANGNVTVVDEQVQKISTDPQNIVSGTSVYVYKSSDFPRQELTNRFTRAIKKEKADIIVIPFQVPSGNFIYANYLFTNANNSLIYVRENHYTQAAITQLASSAGCTYWRNNDNFLYYNSEAIQPYIDFQNGEFNGKVVVTDLELIHYIHKNMTEPSDADTFISIEDMLHSTDASTRALGLKTLAAIDYTMYPATAGHLYSNIGLAINDTSVTTNFLKEVLSYSRCLGTGPRKISHKDFEALIAVLDHDGNKKMAIINKSFMDVTDDLRLVAHFDDSDFLDIINQTAL